MMSSDDNFAWTDASASSNTSVESHEKTKMNHRESKKHGEKTPHKKLYKEDNEAKVKQELLNGYLKRESGSLQDEPPSPAPLPAAHKRKRERSTKRTSSCDSEADLHLLEKKAKRESLASISLHNGHNHQNNYNDDSDQEIQESQNASMSALKKKKSRKSRNETAENDNTDFMKSRKSRNDTENYDENDAENHDTDFIIEDKFEEGESFIESRPAENGLDDTYSQEYVSDTTTEHKSKKSKKKKHRDHSKNLETEAEQIENNQSSLSYQTPDHRQDISPSKETNNLSSNVTANKISDRIQFENEEQIDNHSPPSDTHSAKLWGFLKANPQLQPVTGKPPTLSKDEDVWLLNCPQEIDITSLQGVDITLESKCKLKTNSQTYIGHIQHENSHIPIYIYDHKPVVKHVALNGIVNFRKRIPKAHYVDDNVVQNESDFIPLPETKQRHPLFGADYKKAIKIPSVIKARLSHTNVTSYSNMSAPSDSDARSKKKHRIKVKKESLEVENIGLKERGESDQEVSDKGERKRRRGGHAHDDSIDSQPARKKKKKSIKQEVSTGSWDSERAIEENLFDW